MPDDRTFTAANLSALTGFSDSFHRKLARLGYFPPPVNSAYQMGPTIQGMFKYFRETGARKSGNLEMEKTRKISAEADLATAKARMMERKQIPVDAVMLVWEKVMLGFRAKIMSSGLSEKDRRGVLLDLQPANLEAYFEGVNLSEIEAEEAAENEADET